MFQHVILIVLAFSACGQKTFDEKVKSLYKETVPLIYADELSEKFDRMVLLDTRTPNEYDVSHLEGAIMIDYDTFTETDVASLNKSREIVVYCSVGYRSERIGEKLQEMRFTHVKNLYGGIFDWKNRGLNVLNKKGQSTDSVHTYSRAWAKWLYKGIKVYE